MQDENYRRLYWACRRGMLELDMILVRFLERQYPTLSSAEKHCFEQFLTCSDPDLYCWLTDPSQLPEDPDFVSLVKRIRDN